MATSFFQGGNNPLKKSCVALGLTDKDMARHRKQAADELKAEAKKPKLEPDDKPVPKKSAKKAKK